MSKLSLKYTNRFADQETAAILYQLLFQFFQVRIDRLLEKLIGNIIMLE